MTLLLDIKLIGTDTTLDLSQMAKKGMPLLSRFKPYQKSMEDCIHNQHLLKNMDKMKVALQKWKEALVVERLNSLAASISDQLKAVINLKDRSTG
jgi:hypothetical protein